MEKSVSLLYSRLLSGWPGTRVFPVLPDRGRFWCTGTTHPAEAISGDVADSTAGEGGDGSQGAGGSSGRWFDRWAQDLLLHVDRGVPARERRDEPCEDP